MATLRNYTTRTGLGLAGLFPKDHPDPNSAKTLTSRFGIHPMAMNALAILHEHGLCVEDCKARTLQRYEKIARVGSRRETHLHHENYEER